jgi:hypothetical protein
MWMKSTKAGGLVPLDQELGERSSGAKGAGPRSLHSPNVHFKFFFGDAGWMPP